MEIYAGLEPEAKQLVHEHSEVVARLPLTFLVFTLVDIRKWSSLFQPVNTRDCVASQRLGADPSTLWNRPSFHCS